MCLFVVEQDLRITRLISGTKKKKHYHQSEIIGYYPSDFGLGWSADSWKPYPVTEQLKFVSLFQADTAKIYAFAQNVSYFRLNGSNLFPLSGQIRCKIHAIWVRTDTCLTYNSGADLLGDLLGDFSSSKTSFL